MKAIQRCRMKDDKGSVFLHNFLCRVDGAVLRGSDTFRDFIGPLDARKIMDHGISC